MAAKNSVLILDSMIDIFAQMGVGNALGLQIREIARRLHLIRLEGPWTVGDALMASRLRAMAALYAMRHVPDGGCPLRRAENEARLDEVRAVFVGFRSHLARAADEEEHRSRSAADELMG